MSGTATGDTEVGRQYVELAETIANQAAALAAGTHTGGRHAQVARLRANVETLAAWTKDDRS